MALSLASSACIVSGFSEPLSCEEPAAPDMGAAGAAAEVDEDDEAAAETAEPYDDKDEAAGATSSEPEPARAADDVATTATSRSWTVMRWVLLCNKTCLDSNEH